MNIFAKLKTGLITDSPEATQAIAAELAAALPQDCILALQGDLGSGKTTFVRGLARAWGIRADITSPSYTIYNVHRGQRMLVHLDAYRLPHPNAFHDLMLDELLVSPWCLAVEWPEKLATALPEPACCLNFRHLTTGKHHIQSFPWREEDAH